MKKRDLGRTGLAVSELGMGGLFVSSLGGEYVQARDAILRALELGINYIDTAPNYLNSEEVIGKALRGVSEPLILSTKLGGRPEPFLPQDEDCLMRSTPGSQGKRWCPPPWKRSPMRAAFWINAAWRWIFRWMET